MNFCIEIIYLDFKVSIFEYIGTCVSEESICTASESLTVSCWCIVQVVLNGY